MIENIGIDSFVCTVSPMDEHGFMSFGVGNDYSSKVARAAKTLIVEVNRNMPRVLGSGAQLHVSEISRSSRTTSRGSNCRFAAADPKTRRSAS